MNRKVKFGMIIFLMMAATSVVDVQADNDYINGTLENVFGLKDPEYVECFDTINIQLRTNSNETVVMPLRFQDDEKDNQRGRDYNFDVHAIETLKLIIGYSISISFEKQSIMYIDGNRDGLLEGIIWREVENSNTCEVSFFFLKGDDLPDEDGTDFRIKSEIGTTTAHYGLASASFFLAVPFVVLIKKWKRR